MSEEAKKSYLSFEEEFPPTTVDCFEAEPQRIKCEVTVPHRTLGGPGCCGQTLC